MNFLLLIAALTPAAEPAFPPVSAFLAQIDGAPQEKIEAGPAAALAFERESRGRLDPAPKNFGPRYPDAKGVSFSDTKNIIPLTPELWEKEQLIEDFKKNKTDQQKGIAVIVKTEACVQNSHRSCAVTTAAFEKKSTPAIDNFRVYGLWVQRTPPREDMTEREVSEWEWWQREVQKAYGFRYGPGAAVFVFFPDSDATASGDANKLDLNLGKFDPGGNGTGETPKLEAFLNDALRAAGK